MDFLALEHAVFHGLLHVEDLTAERQDGLEVSVASLLGRAAGGVSLDEEQLADSSVLRRAVGQLSGQPAAREGRLTLHHLARLACRLTSGGREDHLVDDCFGLFRVLLQVVAERLAYSHVDSAHHLVVSELRLGLPLELWLGYLD